MKWPTVPLSSVTSLITKGTTPTTLGKAYAKSGIPFLRAENLQNGVVALNGNLLFIDEETDSLLSRSVIKPNDVLISIAGTIGRVGLVPDHAQRMNCNQAVAIVRPTALLQPRFLMYWLMGWDAVTQMAGSKVTQTISNLSLGQIGNLKLPLPAGGEQSRIVELLDEADRLRHMRCKADAKAARILPALFLKMFGDPAMNPMGWPVVPLSDFANSVNRRNPSISPDEPFQYIDIAGVDGERGLITAAKRMVGRDAPSRARQVVRWRDTVVSTVRPYLRATALVPKELDNEIASTGFCVLRPREPNGYAWLFQLTRLQWFTEQLNVRARGASYPAVTDADIFQLPVPLPYDSKIFEQFDGQFESVSKMLLTAGAASEKVDAIFNLILQRAFSGELTAKWREGHMQELLAEMAHQARALNLPMPKELEALP